MLVDFHVENYRSLRDEQVFSLVAAKDGTLQDENTMQTGVAAVPTLVRSSVLYGPNAGGKSNLIKAFQYMRAVVVESSSLTPEREFKVKPFLLDEDSSKKATRFEVTVVLEGVRYQYGFSMNAARITSEHLLVYRSAKPQTWFNRYYDDAKEQYFFEFSSFLKGKKDSWKDATRANSLFLSMAVLLNSEQLRPLFDWFNLAVTVLNENQKLNPQFSIAMLEKGDGKRAICKFLTAADISLSDIEVVKQKQSSHLIEFSGPDETPKITKEDSEVPELRFKHVTKSGRATFSLDDESTGTRNLLFLTGPVLDILDKGRLLIVDELDTSFHPLLVRRLVNLFHSPTTNPNGAQLIFSTHDTSLLSNNLFRRDQIWFVNKDRDQASTAYPLSDFGARKNEAFEQGYLAGRYGALPFFEADVSE